jgi:hypothetical protein
LRDGENPACADQWEKILDFEGHAEIGILAGQEKPFRSYYHEPLDASKHYDQKTYQRWLEEPEYAEGTSSAFDLGRPDLVDEDGPPFQ